MGADRCSAQAGRGCVASCSSPATPWGGAVVGAGGRCPELRVGPAPSSLDLRHQSRGCAAPALDPGARPCYTWMQRAEGASPGASRSSALRSERRCKALLRPCTRGLTAGETAWGTGGASEHGGAPRVEGGVAWRRIAAVCYFSIFVSRFLVAPSCSVVIMMHMFRARRHRDGHTVRFLIRCFHFFLFFLRFICYE
ncbi:unnamed protein product [Urochloa humidicola]